MSATPASQPKVAVVGATGAVGAQIVELIHERALHLEELALFATEPGSVQEMESDERQYDVSPLQEPSGLAGFDLAFLAVPESHALELIRARPGPLLVDLSGANRANTRGALVAPGLTARERVAELRPGGVFEVPHPAAQVLATILKSLDLNSATACATVMIGASGRGRARMTEMLEQSADLLNARLNVEPGEPQLAFNIFTDTHSRAAGAVISAQVAALCASSPPLLQVVNAPVLHGSAIAMLLPGINNGREVAARLRAAPGLLLVDEAVELCGIVDALGQEAAVVRVEGDSAGCAIWCALDNARLAALSALWIAENLLAVSDFD